MGGKELGVRGAKWPEAEEEEETERGGKKRDAG